MIVASFASQYNLREVDIAEMEWGEFGSLLTGIMPETPLGMIVQIRAEEDKDTLKHFSPAQKSIRDSWRIKNSNSEIVQMTEEEKEESVMKLQDIFAKAFG